MQADSESQRQASLNIKDDFVRNRSRQIWSKKEAPSPSLHKAHKMKA
jgi:hypothetical protein